MSSHEVRNIAICHTCGEMGSKRNMLLLDGKYRHGRCYADIVGEAELLSLPACDLAALTLDDIGPDLMRQVLERV